jgi:hypothetical protein
MLNSMQQSVAKTPELMQGAHCGSVPRTVRLIVIPDRFASVIGAVREILPRFQPVGVVDVATYSEVFPQRSKHLTQRPLIVEKGHPINHVVMSLSFIDFLTQALHYEEVANGDY